LKLATRFNIVACETIGLGAFLVLLALLENYEANGSSVATNFSWVFGFIGAVLILVGLESGSLVRRLPKDS
jgi:putative copper export protein